MGGTFRVGEQLWAGCFSPCSSSLAGSGLEALYRVIGVRQDVAVDGPEDAEEAEGLLALQLGSQAHGLAGLQDTPIWGALGHEEAADEEAEVLVAGKLHQRLWERGGECGTVWCGAGRPAGSPRAAHLVVLQHLSGSLLVRDGQPDVGEGGGIVAQPQAHLHFHRLTDRPCHRVRCFTSYSSSDAHQVCLG